MHLDEIRHDYLKAFRAWHLNVKSPIEITSHQRSLMSWD
jgi:hypothetical protein